MIEYTNEDCMVGMARYPDKYFDLAIVDPPYGGVTQGGYMTNANTVTGSAKHRKYNLSLWEQAKPDVKYFDELFRVLKNQIIWGGNYFQTLIKKDSQCWIVWDKENDNTGFADCELAWTSFNTAIRRLKFMWNGML
jgi:site-specific DNA-methyltransferase (adenine-specific)